MTDYSLTDARAQLPHLLDMAASGAVITITRHGAPSAVLVGHDRWMKSQAQHDALVRARELRAALDAARGSSLGTIPQLHGHDAETHIAEIQAGRDDR